MNIIAEVKKIFGENNCGIEHWTANAGHDDFWCPMPDDEDKIIRLRKLLQDNIDEARKVDNKYIKTFVYMMDNSPDDFFAGSNWLSDNFERLFPGVCRKEENEKI